MKRNTRAAFTLAELLIVVAILGILVAIAIPVFTGSLQKVRDTVCAANRTSAQHLVSVAYMLDRNISEADAKTMIDEQIGVSPCPEGGTYSVELKADGAPVVKCSKHGKTALETVKDNAPSLMKKITSISNYFRDHPGATELNSNGTNFGGTIRKEIAEEFGTTQEFDFRIYRDAGQRKYYLYLFEPLKDKQVGEQVFATRYNIDAGTLGIIGQPTSGEANVIEKTMDDGKTKYLAIDTEHSGSWT